MLLDSIVFRRHSSKPKVSRKPIVAVVVLCLVVSALLIPAAAHLPRWIETELVLVGWWAIWAAVLTWLLYHGHAVDDDVERPDIAEGTSDILLFLLDLASHAGCAVFTEGCAVALIALLFVLLIAFGLGILTEFIIPAIALLLLASVGGMAARAVNDTHDCDGRIGASLLWGSVWATAYIGPIAAIVLVVSMLLTKVGTG